MWRRLSGAAIIVGALLLVPALGAREPAPEVEARLDRAQRRDANPSRPSRCPCRARAERSHDIPLSGDQTSI